MVSEAMEEMEMDLEPDGFDEIFISGNFKVTIAQEENYEVNLDVKDDLKPYVSVEQNGGRLEVRMKSGLFKNKFERGEIFIAAPNIRRVKASGGVELKTRNTIETDQMELEVSGASNVHLAVVADRMETHLSGAGSMDLEGEADIAEISISGAGKVNAYELVTNRLEVHVSGAGMARVHAQEELDVRVSGAASLRYKGNPTISQSISGAGSVRSAN